MTMTSLSYGQSTFPFHMQGREMGVQVEADVPGLCITHFCSAAVNCLVMGSLVILLLVRQIRPSASRLAVSKSLSI